MAGSAMTRASCVVPAAAAIAAHTRNSTWQTQDVVSKTYHVQAVCCSCACCACHLFANRCRCTSPDRSKTCKALPAPVRPGVGVKLQQLHAPQQLNWPCSCEEAWQREPAGPSYTAESSISPQAMASASVGHSNAQPHAHHGGYDHLQLQRLCWSL